MTSFRDKEAGVVIKNAAEELKKQMKMPDWALYVKTGVSRERPPEQEDWWFLRSASVLRRIALDGPVGTQRLRSYYGGRHRRGHKPAHFARGGGKVLRTILQDMEKLGLIEKGSKPKGRKITPLGEKLLAKAAKG